MDWKLPGLRPGRPAPQDLLDRRQMVAGPEAPPGTEVEEQWVSGVRCLTVSAAHPEPTAPPAPAAPSAPAATPARHLVYLHGGGYRMGTPEAWVPLGADLAKVLGATVILPDYRLAPEHPFPAGLIDALSVYDHARKGSPGQLVVAGDSAGGGMAAALTLACRMNGQPIPDALVLLSPWLDMTLSGDTFSSRSESDLFFPRASAEQAAESYLQGQDATDPLVSPLFADLDAFPPTLVFAGTEETLLDDAVRFTEKLAHSGRTVTLEVMAGMQHAWPVTSPALPESSAAVTIFGQFISSVLPLLP